MISKPTTPQLISAVCAELEAKVAPEVDGPTRVVLDMALGILRATAIRSAHELAWMHEEATDIEDLARRFCRELPSTGDIAEELLALEQASTGSMDLADAQATYERASEVLSRATEAAYRSGSSEHVAAVIALVRQRIEHQDAVTGAFEAVGRT